MLYTTSKNLRGWTTDSGAVSRQSQVQKASASLTNVIVRQTAAYIRVQVVTIYLVANRSKLKMLGLNPPVDITMPTPSTDCNEFETSGNEPPAAPVYDSCEAVCQYYDKYTRRWSTEGVCLVCTAQYDDVSWWCHLIVDKPVMPQLRTTTVDDISSSSNNTVLCQTSHFTEFLVAVLPTSSSRAREQLLTGILSYNQLDLVDVGQCFASPSWPRLK